MLEITRKICLSHALSYLSHTFMFVVIFFRSSWSDAGGCPCCSHVLSLLGLQQRCHHLRYRHVEPSPQADQRAAAHAGHTPLHRLPGSRGLRLDSRPGGHAGLALLQLLSADSRLRAATTSRVLRVWHILDQDNGAGEMLANITPSLPRWLCGLRRCH